MTIPQSTHQCVSKVGGITGKESGVAQFAPKDSPLTYLVQPGVTPERF